MGFGLRDPPHQPQHLRAEVVACLFGELVSLDFNDMEMPEEPLYAKLYNLLKSKGIDGVDINNIDEVIYKSSDRILEKFSNVIKGLNENGN